MALHSMQQNQHTRAHSLDVLRVILLHDKLWHSEEHGVWHWALQMQKYGRDSKVKGLEKSRLVPVHTSFVHTTVL
jgi:hypothetical protein